MTRRVHFSNNDSSSFEDCPLVIEICGPLLVPSSEMSILEKQEIWWQPKEFECILEEAKQLGMASRAQECPSTAILASVYKSCCKQGSNSKGPSRKQRYKLIEQWTNVAHSHRGLERVCVREIGMTRTKQKQAVLRGVLVAQERLKKNATFDDKTKLLAVVSKTLTRPARMFAAVMGEADACAVGQHVVHFEDTARSKENEGSQSKALAKLRIGARILRRASSHTSLSCKRDSKRRRSYPL